MAALSGDTQDINDSQSSKSASKNSMQAVQKSFPLRGHNTDRASPKSITHSTTPRQRSPISTTGKSKLVLTPRGRKGEWEYDTRSVKSLQFDKCRRHSIEGSSARDDGSQTSTYSIPGYMASTASTRAKSRLPSPSHEGSETPCKRSLDSPRKRLQFGPSPGSRSGRSSSAPRMRT